MLIFCCGMPRSGGTLLYQLTKEIAEFGSVARGRGFPNKKYKSGVVKTDTCQKWMTERVKRGDALAFGTYRDFRDIVVSLQKFYTRRSAERFGRSEEWSIDRILEYRPNIIKNYYCWQPYATWFRYEMPGVMQVIIDEVAKQLDVSLPDGQKTVILYRYNLRANEERIRNQKVWMEAGGGSMLTKIHISPTKGKSTWRDVLSKDDLKKIEAVGRDWLIEHGYE